MAAPSLRYDKAAILLHWLVALLVLANIALGLYFVHLPDNADFKPLITQTHKSIGLTILLLSLARLVWRLGHKPPPLPASMSPAARFCAHALHGIFYLLLIAIPLAGWSIVSVSPRNIRTVYFGLFVWPHIGLLHDQPLPARMDALKIFVAAHNSMAILALALILLHSGAALYHHWILRDDVLLRMLPDVSQRDASKTP